MLKRFVEVAISLIIAATGNLFAQTIVIEGGLLVDATGRPPISNSVVVIERDRIKAVGQVGSISIPAGAQVINARGKTVLPGLFDSHIHYWDWMPELLIAHGITSVIDTGNRLEWIIAQRDGINSRKIFGPRIFPAGWLIANHEQEERAGGYVRRPGIKNLSEHVKGKTLQEAIEITRLLALSNPGLPNMPEVLEVEDVDSARELTRLLAESGVAFIKTHGAVSLEQLNAIAEEADKFGLRVASHLDGGIDAREAVEAGVDALIHLRGIAEATVSDPKLLAELKAGKFRLGTGGGVYHYAMDPAKFPPLIEFLVKRNIFLQTDFVYSAQALYKQWESFKAERIRLLENKNLGYIAPSDPVGWLNPAWMLSETPADKELRIQGYQKMMRFIKEFVALQFVHSSGIAELI